METQLSSGAVRLSLSRLLRKRVGDGTIVTFEDTPKYRSVYHRYVRKGRWEETELFRDIYRRRIRSGEIVRGCATMKALAVQYYDRVDAMYVSLREYGWLEEVGDKATAVPDVFLADDGELLVGNNGNHRFAMAKILRVPTVVVRIVPGDYDESRES